MSNKKFQYTGSSTAPSESWEAEDDLSSGAASQAPVSVATPTSTSPASSPQASPSQTPPFGTVSTSSRAGNALVTEEVEGDAPVALVTPGEEAEQAGADEEIGNPRLTETQDFFEATQEQLGAESGEDAAYSDLQGIEGFELAVSEEEAGAEPQPAESGTALGGEPEFFGALAGLATSILPALASSMGPKIVRGIAKRLSPKTKRRVIRNRARPARQSRIGGSSVAQLLQLLQKALSQAGGESQGMEEAESVEIAAVAEEVAAVLEVVIGKDDRVHITNTTRVPWRRICALRIRFPSGSTYRGTGFLIGPRAVATAGHCVYLRNQGGWAQSVEVIPGMNGDSRPHGQATSTAFRSVRGWVQSGRPQSDYGCVVLPSGAFGGINLGSFGFRAATPSQMLARSVVLAGYPGDKPFAELWGMARKIKRITSSTLEYDIDTMGGQSGAPIYSKIGGQRHVVGIHNYGASSGNSATRITEGVYQRLLAWSKL